jgi:hypothetical protein
VFDKVWFGLFGKVELALHVFMLLTIAEDLIEFFGSLQLQKLAYKRF